MAIQSLALSQLQPSAGNPRKRFNDDTIAGLAMSIKTDGILQNLIVAKPLGKRRKFTIIAGERRYRAAQLLVEQGEWAQDHEIPVEIKDNLSDEDVLRIATMENVQRENLSPLEEATAIAALIQDGEKLDNIVAQTGLGVSTIRRRLVLLDLSEGVKDALASGEINLAQAEALSVGGIDEQDGLLESIVKGRFNDPDDIRERLVGELPTLSMAIFPKDLYTGSFTTDLFAADETTYFNDAEQFFALQKEAAEQLVRVHAKCSEWAELCEGHFASWQYKKAEGEEKGGVIICLKSSGAVEIHEGLLKTRADQSTTTALKQRPKATYPTPLRRYIAMHKSAAVQAALLGNPRKAKELAVARKLSSFSNHACLTYFMREKRNPPALLTINQEAKALLKLFGDVTKKVTWNDLGNLFHGDVVKAYDAVQQLSDEQLERVFIGLEAMEFGQSCCDALDTCENSLFNRIARDLNVDMRTCWRPDEEFLKRRNRAQLLQIMIDSGANRLLGSGASCAKGELVNRLAQHFEIVQTVPNPSEDVKMALNWLPEAMAFPAIDPDRKDGMESGIEDDDIAGSNDEI